MDKWRGGLSYGAFIKKLLTDNAVPYDQGFNAGYEEGYRDATINLSICYDCCICGQPILDLLRNYELKVGKGVQKWDFTL
ncbi:MAG: hypothetical protein EF807_00915 [Candidatus Methanolliviera hydrocarbonicum]|uniref:Uncharacterized protein n=1 Tax=Candidatus Methanolliviera hydrocarbonicum TaxID=2491085 RepID=A0A520KYM3_9EURY|nr:MAG: hypothetical protein EF807_00915 [Candidatus Methanolliviera hydrocarbonicum]